MNIHLLQKLQQHEEQNLTRSLQEPIGVDFCSNDYLSFVADPILQKRIYENLAAVASGSTSSRLIRGQYPQLTDLESRLAHWSSRETAIYFSSGYQANLAAMTALLDEESMVFSDESNHASLVDGIRLSKSDKIIFKHNDLLDLEERLSVKTVKNKIVVIESLYSMRGDRAPLKQVSELCQKHNALLVVDEAHATGLYGAGLVQLQSLQSQVLMTIHCAGKSLGVGGAWIACDAITKEYLVNFSRPLIYSTAPSPLLASALTTALDYWDDVGAGRAELCLQKMREFKQKLEQFMNPEILSGDGPILYFQLGENLQALHWAQYLQFNGFDVRAIRYPTVPQGQAGLRISLHASQAPDDIQDLIRCLRERVLAC